MKKCRICGQDKPLSEFHKNKGNKDGHATLCRACQAAYQQSRKSEIFEYGLMYKYGITKAKYNEIFEKQGRVCALCTETDPRSSGGRGPHTICAGQRNGCGSCVRGILCDDCNVLVGKVERLKNKSDLLKYLDGRP